MKYLFIDTNIYIQCCILELKNEDNLETLKKLSDLIRKEKITLLLPDVVELELRRRLNEKKVQIEERIDKLKETVNKDEILGEKLRKDLHQDLTKRLKELNKNSEDVEKELSRIFTSAKSIKIVSRDLINAYKLGLTREKPYKAKRTKGETGLVITEIQPDCLNLVMLERYFRKKKSYKFFFCSNDSDFFKVEKSEDTETIEPYDEIISKFSDFKCYRNLFELLNSEFSGKFTEKEIEELAEVPRSPLYETIENNGLLQNWREVQSIWPGNPPDDEYVNTNSTRIGLDGVVIDPSTVSTHSIYPGHFCRYCSTDGYVQVGQICPMCNKVKPVNLFRG